MVTALSSATIGREERSWSQRSWSSRPGRERLLDQLHAQALQLRQQRERPLGRPARVGVHPDRAREHGPDGLERLEVGRPAHLDLERREAGGPDGPARRPRPGSSMPEREVGRRDRAGIPSSSRTGSPSRLPARSWRAMSTAHLVAPWWPIAALISPSASSSAARTAVHGSAQTGSMTGRAPSSSSGATAAIVAGVSP